MIKVIASDMDGTLLGDDHKPAPETLAAVKKACDAGIRFMIATGRNFPGAMAELKDAELVCDYIVGSGAEVRNPQQEVVVTHPISIELCRAIYEEIRDYPLSVTFCTDGYDYKIGTPEEIEESLMLQMQLFFSNLPREELAKSETYRRIKKSTRSMSDMDELEAAGVPVYKLFLYSEDKAMLDEMNTRLQRNKDIAVASSFPTNLEITDVKAQKGPVLKEYIESLGYTMDEVMVLGDSLNDLSMISMDFGATVAMANADPEVKSAAKYITKSNTEFGVAYAIEELLKRQESPCHQE
ncbi:HAD family phosphatase [Mediterraneibacter catenae]|uniref:HAD family phosphatase n=1 Tax=Mediterraneibacter catenae TaxID=2594882 RepID=A0A5M9HVS6_9FIRM|nr:MULTISPECIES: Cof-type HAD-IIB family hydrolase [Mediterraneibacter]KAA8501074.1 HAD family phosphatase [Mediterraneibacter catenae]MDN0061725.1 Cof-type HAD-IIB family hydrolase [Mediterraneibacter glycyrrhizinilyticus]